ncbi:hypothetical protein FY528_04965 [Hymenobacter lutimineralis]|uniref:Lantibiotic dehydratase n=1 Tax=Hymenobacter lutimineralis TaxID=2606448 RepID=A0A5D6VD33_9BACT|nr:lantibiotic dehydratase [Hymenobacter lutimineralis]TYZ12648.1 hypothetical protein FY528_04965 [Hymenobacter lutimineralis]
MLSHCGFFFLRSPVLPFEVINNLSVSSALKLYHDPFVKEALFVASPALYEVLERWRKGELTDTKELDKLEVTLAKYLLRMGYRSTPFGLFAGVSRGEVATTTNIEFVTRDAYRKHVRLDMDYLCALALSIARDPSVRAHLTYFPNTTLYQTGDSLRLVEYRVFNRHRSHHLINLDANEYLQKALHIAKNGATVATLVEQLADEEISPADAVDFVHELLDSQILISKLEPTVTGKDYLLSITDTIASAPGSEQLVRQLQTLRAALLTLSTLPSIEAVQGYKDLEQLLKPLGVSYELGQLFQVDLRKPTIACSLNQGVFEELQRALRFLLRINRPNQEKNLTRFSEAFQTRYEGQEVALPLVLDAEMGLGYPFQQGNSTDHTPLLAEVLLENSPSESATFRWNAWSKFVLDAYLGVISRQEVVLRLDALDLSGFMEPEDRAEVLPFSLYSMISVLASSPQAVDDGAYTILYHGLDGPSAANYLGRFCYLDEQLTSDVKACLAREASNYPEAVLAEVAHINQSRAGNVIIRPVLREYEIPILVQSGVDENHTLPLHDLLLSFRNGRLVLQSKKLGREVIPRMSSAHNHFFNTLPAYHFLCDLQWQGAPVHAKWDWGPVGKADFLPRVEYGKVILSRAQWTLTEGELKPIKNVQPETALGLLQELRIKHRIPQWVSLRESDNELPLDLKNPLSVRVFQALIKTKDRITVQECLLNQQQTFVQGQNQSFNNEIVVPLQSTSNVPTQPVRAPKSAWQNTQPRSFGMGSEWAYFKIYCGVKTADHVLTEYMQPLAEALKAEGIIDRWFFIRYNDPGHHLRIRFHGQGTFYAPLIKCIHQVLQPLAATMQIESYCAETYKPEIERYGALTMAASETLFWRDSEAVTSIISQLDPGDSGDELRWLIAMRGTDALLQDFGLTLEDKKTFFHSLQDHFKKEFNAHSALTKKSLGNRYRKERARIEEIMSATLNPESELFPVLEALAIRSRTWQPAVEVIVAAHRSKQLEVQYFGLLESYVHMFLNRLFRSKQRVQEMVLYDFLYQFYTSALAKERRAVPAALKLEKL